MYDSVEGFLTISDIPEYRWLFYRRNTRVCREIYLNVLEAREQNYKVKKRPPAEAPLSFAARDIVTHRVCLHRVLQGADTFLLHTLAASLRFLPLLGRRLFGMLSSASGVVSPAQQIHANRLVCRDCVILPWTSGPCLENVVETAWKLLT